MLSFRIVHYENTYNNEWVEIFYNNEDWENPCFKLFINRAEVAQLYTSELNTKKSVEQQLRDRWEGNVQSKQHADTMASIEEAGIQSFTKLIADSEDIPEPDYDEDYEAMEREALSEQSAWNTYGDKFLKS